MGEPVDAIWEPVTATPGTGGISGSGMHPRGTVRPYRLTSQARPGSSIPERLRDDGQRDRVGSMTNQTGDRTTRTTDDGHTCWTDDTTCRLCGSGQSYWQGWKDGEAHYAGRIRQLVEDLDEATDMLRRHVGQLGR